MASPPISDRSIAAIPNASLTRGSAPGQKRKIAVLLIDEHQMFTDAMSHRLAVEEDVALIGAVRSPHQGVAACRRIAPDVILVDLVADADGGVECIRSLKQVAPGSAVIVLTSRDDPAAITSAIRAGARGYVLKTRGVDDLLMVIRKAAAGEDAFPLTDVSVLRGIHVATQHEVDAARTFSRLTVRERQILAEFVKGSSTAGTAAVLHISPLTVRSHVKSILAKLGVHSKLEAVTYVMRHGLLDADRSA